jgi:prepilin-type processing-associated H-X9-DG protein
LTRVEVVVLLVLGMLTVLLIVMGLPRGREHARLASCQYHMAMIGKALAEYEQPRHTLPGVPAVAALDTPSASRPAGPLRTMLETLQLPSFLPLNDTTKPLQRSADLVPGEIPVPGFVCSSDPNATAGRFQAPISYRATTGDDITGSNGAFAPGRVLKLSEVEANDGRSYTAAFSERLAGNNANDHVAPFNYRVVQIPGGSAACPDSTDLTEWRGDAGSSWYASDYRFTLYNHALPPGGRPSCTSPDGTAAFMGASSGHERGVNVLMLDGSVSMIRPTVFEKIWRELARIGRPPEDP